MLQTKKSVVNLQYVIEKVKGFDPNVNDALKLHYSKKYEVAKEHVLCFPKPGGVQLGVKVVILNPETSAFSKVLYIKWFWETISNNEDYYDVSSNALFSVDLKELFVYKVLEKVGYGPKTCFVILGDFS